ncbi:hypothetical protein [Priestia megaterium]|uniref:hypothetical protein n=1 Tax=Priestia megaterium TaxID=1404 RepID=UPI002EB964BF|nr:hypothetical protein [Priestia megaterium]
MEAMNEDFAKNGQVVYPYYHEREDERGTIYVRQSPLHDSPANNLCIIYFEVKEKCSVYIHDIKSPGGVNKGYGSVAMRALITHSINKGYLGITGCLSHFDSGHISRLISFYEKNSFDIKLYSTENSGIIQLDLTHPTELLENLTTIPFQEKIASLEHDSANESKLLKFLKKYI